MEGVGDYLIARFQAWCRLAASPNYQLVVAFLLALVACDIIRRGWRRSLSRRAIESVSATLAIFHINLLLVPGVLLLTDQVRSAYGLLGIPRVPASVWSGLPMWLLTLLGLLAMDFANYWNHRLLHMKWLWPVHAIHHSDPVVNGATSYRVHALENLVMWSSYILLLTWIGLPDEAIGFAGLIIVFHNIYVHIDVDWGHGPFRLLIASPRFHRWHHADVPAAYGKNLANVFPFYDRLFGTYRVPGPCEADLGATGVPRNDVVRLTLWPLIGWSKLMSDWFRRKQIKSFGVSRSGAPAE